MTSERLMYVQFTSCVYWEETEFFVEDLDDYDHSDGIALYLSNLNNIG